MIAVDQTVDRKGGAGQRGAVIRLPGVAGLDGQRHLIIDGEGDLRHGGGHGYRFRNVVLHCCFIARQEGGGDRCALRLADLHTAGHIAGDGNGRAVEVVVDGVRDCGLNVVDLDDVVGLVDADSQRQPLGLAELVALADLVGIVVDHAAVIGLGGHGFSRIEHAVVVVLDGVAVLIDRPLCVQVVRRGAVNAGLPAFCEGKTLAVSLRVPAGEGVAHLRGKIGLIVGLDRNQAVVRNVVGRNDLVGAKVAVVGDGDRLRCLAVNGGQFDIAVDRDRVVRVIPVASVILPIEEDHVREGGVRTVEDGGGCALAVVVDIGNKSAVAARGIIGHGVAGLAAELGDQREVTGDQSVLLERLAVSIDPAEEVLALGGIGGCGKGDGALVRNVRHRLIGRLADHEGDRMHRRGPVGVYGDVLRGHGLAGEDERLRARGVSVPAGEDIRCVDALGSRRRVASGIGDGGLERVRLRVHRLAVVHIDHAVVVAGVVEFGAVVVIANFRTLVFIEGIAGNGVLILFGYRRTTACTRVGVIEYVVAVQTLKIVMGFCTSLFGLIELKTIQRHGPDVGLVGASVLGSSPGAARPLIANVSAVFGGDAFGGYLFPVVAGEK